MTALDRWEARMERDHPRAYVIVGVTWLLLFTALAVVLAAVLR